MSSFVSPMQPVAPPTKKIKADLDNVEAVRKRRDELNKLKQKQQMRTAEKTTPGGTKVRMTSSEGLLAHARSQLDGQQHFRAAARPPAPPAPPGALPLDRVRHSDIFPTVAKVTSRIPPPRAGNFPPPPGSRPGHVSPSRRQHQAVEPVVRRLAFEQGKSPAASPASRSKSAPPVRPPPPPGPPPLAKDAPGGTPSRGFAARPPPMTPGVTPKQATGGFKVPAMAAAARETPPPGVSTPKGPPAPGSPPVIPSVPYTSQLAPEHSSLLKHSPAITSNGKKENRPPICFSQPVQGQTATVPPTPEPASAVPQKPRQDLIRNLHHFADTPNGSAKVSTPPPSAHDGSSSMLRLEKQVREHEKGKTEALRRVTILEEQLQKLKEKGDPEEELGTLVHMAEKEGDDAALQWARGRVAGTTPKSTSQVGFFSPLSPGLTSPRAVSRKRVPTPHPKRNQQDRGTGEDQSLFSESVKYTPFEYTTDLATFIIRRPYGSATERELWFKAGYMNSKQYEKTADVKKPHTLEIIAQITADGSTLSLHGSAFVRHISADADADWTEFGRVDEMGKPLGSITYIDRDANEKDYSLDDVFEGALAARESYCTSIMSMAVGLKTKESTGGKTNVPSAMPPGVGLFPPVQKAQTTEIGVGTEDLSLPAGPPDSQTNHAEPASGEKGEKMPPKQGGPPMDEDDGLDMGSFVLQSFVSVLVWIVKTVLITIPFRIVSFTLLSFIAFTVLSLVSLQLADDHGAANMGAGFDTMFNRPRIV